MNELIAISVLIGDRSYRIKIQPEEEQVVRKTVKALNDKIIEYKTQFAGKDMQDYIAMVLVWYASEQNAAETMSVERENLSSQLDSIERMLDNQLEEK